MSKYKDTIKKGHFKDYDKDFYSDSSYGTGESDSEGDASSRVSNSKMIDDVQSHLWKNAKVDKDGNYIISRKSWDSFFKSIKKDIEKYGPGKENGKDD